MIELSIVIPTYNRAKRLRACLEALTRQTQSSSTFEVIVVVDGSTDETVEMLKNFDAPYSLRAVWQNNSGQPAALNRGIHEAKSQYCLFLDDDMIAAPGFVIEHLQAQREHPKIVVIGQISITLPSHADWYANAFARGWQDHYDLLNEDATKLTWEDCYSGNMSAPREALLQCGGFDVSLVRGFDVELARRLERQGYKLVYVPNALSCQQEEKSFRQLSRDAENAGRVDVLLYRQDPSILTEALASFAQGSWRKLLLRRLLLMLLIPPGWLEFLGRFIKNPNRRYTLYSLTQTHCYWRGVRKNAGKELWSQLTYGTPILMYHAIGSPQEQDSPYVMPAHRFSKQLKWLKRMGYRPISLSQFLACKRERRLAPTGSVVITFDDGYVDNYTLAYPILKQQDVPVTIFLVSGYIGLTNQWDQQKQLAGRPLMSWSQIRELIERSVNFGVHTCTHPRLTAISADQVDEEINISRQQLETGLGAPVDVFAYPYGEYDESVRSLVERAGFAAACTVDAGLNTMHTSAYLLQRTEIWGTDSLPRFLLSLWLGDAEALGWRRSRKQS